MVSKFFCGSMQSCFAVSLSSNLNKYLQSSSLQGRNEGGQGERKFPGRWVTMRAPNHCGVGRMAEGRQKVPTMSQVLCSVQYICFRKTLVFNMGASNFPGRHLTSLRLCFHIPRWHISKFLGWRSERSAHNVEDVLSNHCLMLLRTVSTIASKCMPLYTSVRYFFTRSEADETSAMDSSPAKHLRHLCRFIGRGSTTTRSASHPALPKDLHPFYLADKARR